MSEATDRWRSGHVGAGDFDSPDGWLRRLKPDVIIAFFGYNESFKGPEGLDNYKAELMAFVRHTKSMKYNGERAPRRHQLRSIGAAPLTAAGNPAILRIAVGFLSRSLRLLVRRGVPKELPRNGA